MTWCYDRVPGFAAISETRLSHSSRDIATFASVVTRLLWGEDVRRPTYFAARRWFLRVARRAFTSSRSFRFGCRSMD